MGDSVPKGVGDLLVMGHVELDSCRLPIIRLKPKVGGPLALVSFAPSTLDWLVGSVGGGEYSVALYLANKAFPTSLPRVFRGRGTDWTFLSKR